MAAATPSNLLGSAPIPRTRLIGREAERTTAKALLLDEAVPLVTLSGPGGVGKTRLAQVIAHDVATHFVDGVVWVDLAPLTDPTLVLPAIARVLGLRDSSGEPFTEQLIGFLRERTLLLVLDNFEHHLPAASQLSDVLARCSRLQILVTSRSVLSLSGECNLPVPPLPVPHEHEAASRQEIATSPAVQLFVARARAMRPDFELTEANAAAIAAICRSLDGLPLAIEQATARVAHLPLAGLLQRLEHRLPLLTGGARDVPARLQTMRDAIAWSYDLLSPDVQALFRRLAVFVGGFTPEAATAVVGTTAPQDAEVIDGIATLIDQSLVQLVVGTVGEPRYLMLETIREFGRERLVEASEEDAVRQAHAAHYLAFAEQAASALHGPDEGSWLDQVEIELPNMRAALGWAEAHGEGQMALRLAGAAHWFWHMRGHPGEGRTWLERALAMHPVMPSVARAKALDAASLLAWHQGDCAQAMLLAEACLALGQELDDPVAIAGALRTLGLVAVQQERFEDGRGFHEAALARFRALGDRFSVALGLLNLSSTARDDRSWRMALQQEALDLFRALDNPWGTARALASLGRTVILLGDPAAGGALVREGLALNWLRRDRWQIIACLELLAEEATASGHAERAARLLGAATALREAIGVNTDLIHDDRDDPLTLVVGPDPAFAAAWEAGKALSLEEAVAEGLVEPMTEATAAPSDTEHSAIAGLTRREREVLRLLAEGQSDREIAGALFISPKTASVHVSNLLGKLGVPSRAAAVAFIHRHDLA